MGLYKMGLMVIDGRVFVSFSFLYFPSLSIYPRTHLYFMDKQNSQIIRNLVFGKHTCYIKGFIFDLEYIDGFAKEEAHWYNPFCFSFGHSATLHIMVIQE